MKRYIVLDENNVITTEIFTPVSINKDGVYESAIGNLGDTVSIMQNKDVVVTKKRTAPKPDLSRISKLEFLKRFTQAERIKMRTDRQTNAELDDFIWLLDSATNIDLNDQDFHNGMRTLVQLKIINQNKKDTIMGVQ